MVGWHICHKATMFDSLVILTFLSDYGYYRRENTSECVRQSSSPNKTLELCLNGEEDELFTAGY